MNVHFAPFSVRNALGKNVRWTLPPVSFPPGFSSIVPEAEEAAAPLLHALTHAHWEPATARGAIPRPVTVIGLSEPEFPPSLPLSALLRLASSQPNIDANTFAAWSAPLRSAKKAGFLGHFQASRPFSEEPLADRQTLALALALAQREPRHVVILRGALDDFGSPTVVTALQAFADRGARVVVVDPSVAASRRLGSSLFWASSRGIFPAPAQLGSAADAGERPSARTIEPETRTDSSTSTTSEESAPEVTP
jgi:hypothetical protein